MLAKELISDLIISLSPADTVAQALTMMSIYHVKDLPVVSNDILLGILTEEDATTEHPDTAIRDIRINNSYNFAKSRDHVFEVLGIMAKNKITIIPVVDEEEKYIGIITQENLISFYAKSFSFSEPGAIIVIETSRRGYSLSEIARIVELENTSVLASFISASAATELVLLTLKLNTQEPATIVSALERYDYKVSASFTESDYADDLKDRYDQLMNYLNV
ncbi:MAG: CBS domain-containing protein [Chitinophagia bacterium]|nr:CBS domain-containing protein [Chitinophagia bacterium]